MQDDLEVIISGLFEQAFDMRVYPFFPDFRRDKEPEIMSVVIAYHIVSEFAAPTREEFFIPS